MNISNILQKATIFDRKVCEYKNFQYIVSVDIEPRLYIVTMCDMTFTNTKNTYLR